MYVDVLIISKNTLLIILPYKMDKNKLKHATYNILVQILQLRERNIIPAKQ